jgi:hypothetical protein
LTSARIGEALDASCDAFCGGDRSFAATILRGDRVVPFRLRFASAVPPLLLHADPAGAGMSLAFAAWSA